MFGQLAYCPHITLLSARGQTAQPQTLDHSLSQFSHGYTSRLKLDLSSGSVGGWDSPLRVIELTQRDGGKSSTLRVALSSTTCWTRAIIRRCLIEIAPSRQPDR